jgi:hypothetical protein
MLYAVRLTCILHSLHANKHHHTMPSSSVCPALRMLLESAAAASGPEQSKSKGGKKKKAPTQRQRPSGREPQNEGGLHAGGRRRLMRGAEPATATSRGSRGDEAKYKKVINTSDLHGDGVSSDDGNGNDASALRLLSAARARASKMLLVDREVRRKQQQQQQRKRSRTDEKAIKVPSKRKILHSSSRLAVRLAASSCTAVVGCGRSSAAQAVRTDHHVPTATQALIRQRKEQRMMEEITRSLRGVVAKPATSSKSKTKG